MRIELLAWLNNILNFNKKRTKLLCQAITERKLEIAEKALLQPKNFIRKGEKGITPLHE